MLQWQYEISGAGCIMPILKEEEIDAIINTLKTSKTVKDIQLRSRFDKVEVGATIFVRGNEICFTKPRIGTKNKVNAYQRCKGMLGTIHTHVVRRKPHASIVDISNAIDRKQALTCVLSAYSGEGICYFMNKKSNNLFKKDCIFGVRMVSRSELTNMERREIKRKMGAIPEDGIFISRYAPADSYYKSIGMREIRFMIDQ